MSFCRRHRHFGFLIESDLNLAITNGASCSESTPDPLGQRCRWRIEPQVVVATCGGNRCRFASHAKPSGGSGHPAFVGKNQSE